MQFTERTVKIILCYAVSDGGIYVQETIRRMKKKGLIKKPKKTFKKIKIDKYSKN